MSMLPKRKVETNELILLDSLESIGIENVQNILRLDEETLVIFHNCLLYTSPSPRDLSTSRMPSSA